MSFAELNVPQNHVYLFKSQFKKGELSEIVAPRGLGFWYNTHVQNDTEMSTGGNQIVVYQPNEIVRLDVRLENKMVLLNQSRFGELLGVDWSVVNHHIHNI